jgi:membrane protein DedA with SNARE-associated domain
MTVLVVRFLPGLRAPTFLLAGAMYMPFRQFFWLDFVAALVSVPLVTYLGYAFAPQFESLLKMFHRVELIVVAVIFMGVLLYWVFKIRNRQAA